MNVNDAFDTYQRYVNADESSLTTARERRDLFKSAFEPQPDISRVLRSGSLARGTQRDPIHDVDMILIYDGLQHPEWGAPGRSAEDALDYTRDQVKSLLGTSDGSFAKEVRLARWRNHAVKCWLDEPEAEGAFTVDAMPALRRDGMLIIPEAISKTWIPAHPEFLIDLVDAKHAQWNKFAGTVRMLKAWGSEQDIKIKSLVMEVLATEFLPTAKTRFAALDTFFTAAAFAVENGHRVSDPADVCGEIQADLEYGALADLLRNAASLASAAVAKQVNNNPHGAITLWGELFGAGFPVPPAGSAEDAAAGTAAADGPRRVKDTPQG